MDIVRNKLYYISYPSFLLHRKKSRKVKRCWSSYKRYQSRNCMLPAEGGGRRRRGGGGEYRTNTLIHVRKTQ